MKSNLISLYVFLNFVFLLEVQAGELKLENERLYSRVAYSVESSTLDATNLGAWGWHTKEKKVTTAASKGSIDLVWGTKWYQHFALEGYSTRGFFPSEIGEGPNEDVSLDRVAVIWGTSKESWPSFKFSRTEYYAKGIVDGTIPLYKNGQLLANGDEFDAGVTYDSLMLIWDSADTNPSEHYKTRSFRSGIGLAHLEFLGSREEWGSNGPPTKVTVEEKVDGYGIVVYVEGIYGAIKLSPGSYAYAGCHAEAIATGIGGMIKGGYEVGLCFEPSENMRVRPYVGGYFWPISNWESDFGAIETNFGYSFGLQLEYVW